MWFKVLQSVKNSWIMNEISKKPRINANDPREERSNRREGGVVALGWQRTDSSDERKGPWGMLRALPPHWSEGQIAQSCSVDEHCVRNACASGTAAEQIAGGQRPLNQVDLITLCPSPLRPGAEQHDNTSHKWLAIKPLWPSVSSCLKWAEY